MRNRSRRTAWLATRLQDLSADDVGRVLALQGMVMIGSTPVGGPLLGSVCDAFGARAGIVLGAVAAVGAGIWGLYPHRRVTETANARHAAATVL